MVSTEGRSAGRRPRVLLLGLVAVVVVWIAAQPETVLAGWERLTQLVTLAGEPIAAAQPVLSDHEIERLARLPAQDQAEGLLERAIGGFRGANELIEAEVDGWRGQIRADEGLRRLLTAALNAHDLRVRAAAIEIWLAAYGVAKTPEEVERQRRRAEAGAEGSYWALWHLGLLANRGVESDAIFADLVSYLRHPDFQMRHWAIEGLAYSGDERMIPYLLEVFRDDPSPHHQERAACSLAQSGMLSAEARFRAVPTFVGYLEEPSFEPVRRRWARQALVDITGRRDLPDAAAWRRWWEGERRARGL